MRNIHSSFTKAARAALALVALLSVSACAPGAAPHNNVAWENVYGGLLIENIYTGDDHI